MPQQFAADPHRCQQPHFRVARNWRESNPQSPRFELGRFAGLRTVPYQPIVQERPRRDLNA